MNPLEMIGKAGKGVGQFGSALLRGLEEYARMQALGPDYKERQQESGERSAYRRAQLELAMQRVRAMMVPKEKAARLIETSEGWRWIRPGEMPGPVVSPPMPEVERPGSFTFEDTAEGIRAGNRQTGELGDIIGKRPPKEPTTYKPTDYMGRATAASRRGLEEGTLTVPDVGEMARELEEFDQFGGPPQDVGEYLERPDRLNPQPRLSTGVREERGGGPSLSDIVAAAKGGTGTPTLGDPDATVTVRSKEEALALPEGQIFQIEGRPEFYIKGVGEQVEQITE